MKINCCLCNEPLYVDEDKNLVHHYDDHRFWFNEAAEAFAFTSLELFDIIYEPNEVYRNDIWNHFIYYDFTDNTIEIEFDEELIFKITEEEPIFYWKNLKELGQYIKKRMVFE